MSDIVLRHEHPLWPALQQLNETLDSGYGTLAIPEPEFCRMVPFHEMHTIPLYHGSGVSGEQDTGFDNFGLRENLAESWEKYNAKSRQELG